MESIDNSREIYAYRAKRNFASDFLSIDKGKLISKEKYERLKFDEQEYFDPVFVDDEDYNDDDYYVCVQCHKTDSGEDYGIGNRISLQEYEGLEEFAKSNFKPVSDFEDEVNF